ncbi:MAG: hypothetical protein ACFFFK_08810 [Candidatus Thorarchaeota archaeon]
MLQALWLKFRYLRRKYTKYCKNPEEKTKKMLAEDESETLSLDQMLKLLRQDVTIILAQLDQSESLSIEDQVLEDERWLASSEESRILDFIRSMALIATQLQPESFEETRNNLTEFWIDVVSEDNWEDSEEEE